MSEDHDGSQVGEEGGGGPGAPTPLSALEVPWRCSVFDVFRVFANDLMLRELLE
jgi:hypothetical protein